MRLTTAFSKLVAVSILVAMALMIPAPVRADRLGSDKIALFPKEVGDLPMPT